MGSFLSSTERRDVAPSKERSVGLVCLAVPLVVPHTASVVASSDHRRPDAVVPDADETGVEISGTRPGGNRQRACADYSPVRPLFRPSSDQRPEAVAEDTDAEISDTRAGAKILTSSSSSMLWAPFSEIAPDSREA